MQFPLAKKELEVLGREFEGYPFFKRVSLNKAYRCYCKAQPRGVEAKRKRRSLYA